MLNAKLGRHLAKNIYIDDQTPHQYELIQY